MSAPTGLDVECLALVAQEVERRGSVKAVATAIGYARPSLSLAMRGRYQGSLAAMSAAIRETLGARVTCPHVSIEIAAADCKGHRERPIHTADPAILRQWAACQTCVFNPNRRTS